jgi:hypothetical protein
MIAPGLGLAADIAFADRFQKSNAESRIIIQAAPADVLVIESGIYYLDGRSLVIAAETVRLNGDAKIISYKDEDYPPVIPGTPGNVDGRAKAADEQCGGRGCNGDTGFPGNPGLIGTGGKKPGRIELDVKAFEGNGTLEVIGNGQTGGEGQKGGQGGTGGQAGRGNDRSCGGFLGLDTRRGPGDAGDAGPGGARGQGGKGGPGGPGAEIFLLSRVSDKLQAGMLKISAPGGIGGKGGAPGEPGVGGLGNDGGSGASCGGGGRGSGRGAGGPDGLPSEAGDRGNPGQVVLVNAEEPTKSIVWLPQQ